MFFWWWSHKHWHCKRGLKFHSSYSGVFWDFPEYYMPCLWCVILIDYFYLGSTTIMLNCFHFVHDLPDGELMASKYFWRSFIAFSNLVSIKNKSSSGLLTLTTPVIWPNFPFKGTKNLQVHILLPQQICSFGLFSSINKWTRCMWRRDHNYLDHIYIFTYIFFFLQSCSPLIRGKVPVTGWSWAFIGWMPFLMPTWNSQQFF